MIYVKKHRTRYGDLIALCDEEVLEKLSDYKEFFNGELVEETGVIIEEYMSINAWGERSIAVLKSKFKNIEKAVKMINGIPHVQVYRV